MSKNPANVSRNFAMVAEGTRRGNGDKRGKNIPDTSGNMTISVPLDFLFRQREKMRARNGKSMLLSVFKAVGGELDPMKKRLIDYGFFGKKYQSNIKSFRDEQIEQFFVWGQNMTSYEVRKIDHMMAMLCRALGDDKATKNNFRKSEKFNDALREAKGWDILVVGRYDDGFVGIDDENDTNAFINLAYVKFGTGKIPLISAFDRPQKDGLVEFEHNGKKYKDYILDPEGSISLITTRGYLKNFNSNKKDVQNLRMYQRKEDGASFWVVNVGSYDPKTLPGEFFASFSGHLQELLVNSDRISFEYGLKETDSKLIDDILSVGKKGDNASLVFTGLISDDESRIKTFTTEPDPETGEVKTYVDIRLIRGTFFTQRLFKN